MGFDTPTIGVLPRAKVTTLGPITLTAATRTTTVRAIPLVFVQLGDFNYL